MWYNSSVERQAIKERTFKGMNSNSPICVSFIKHFELVCPLALLVCLYNLPPVVYLIHGVIKKIPDGPTINCEVALRMRGKDSLSLSVFLKKLSQKDDGFDVHHSLCIPGVMWDYQSLKPPDCSSLVAQQAADADSRISCLCSRWA